MAERWITFFLSVWRTVRYESREPVIDSFRESTVPLSEDETAAMQAGRIHSDVEADEDDIDDVLYR